MSATLDEHYRNIGEGAVSAANAEALIGAVVHSANGNEIGWSDESFLLESSSPGRSCRGLTKVIRDCEVAIAARRLADDHPYAKTVERMRNLLDAWSAAIDERHQLMHSFVTPDTSPDETGAFTLSTGDPLTHVAIHPRTGKSSPLLENTRRKELVDQFDAIYQTATALLAPAAAATEGLGVCMSAQERSGG